MLLLIEAVMHFFTENVDSPCEGGDLIFKAFIAKGLLMFLCVKVLIYRSLVFQCVDTFTDITGELLSVWVELDMGRSGHVLREVSTVCSHILNYNVLNIA